MEDATLPLLLEPFQHGEVSDKRIWIGNLDTRVNDPQAIKYGVIQHNMITLDDSHLIRQSLCRYVDSRLKHLKQRKHPNTYQLLKMVRVYGNIEKFDMLFHRSGPSTGQPRGFAFVTYKLRQDAIKAMTSLNGQMLGTKRMSVKFAKNTDEQEKPKPELGIAVLAGAKPELKLSKKTAIQSIEAKLKMMENMKAGDDFVINKLAANETPVISQYQTKQYQPQNKSATSFRRRHPYHKKR